MLDRELSNAEIIEFNNSFWVIDKEKEYWYFELNDSKLLWWRYDFFRDFFLTYSLEKDEFEPFLIEWVENRLRLINKIETVLSADFWAGSQNNYIKELLNFFEIKTNDNSDCILRSMRFKGVD